MSDSRTSLAAPAPDAIILLAKSHDKVTDDEFHELTSTFPTGIAKSCLSAHQILSKLESFKQECESWEFSVLGHYDFEQANQARVFDAEVAAHVSTQCSQMLFEMKTLSGNIEQLKLSVLRMTSHLSDPATLLTSLVLRIVSLYSELETMLQLSRSRANLIKVNDDLSKLQSHPELTGDVKQPMSPLVKAYRSFVSNLVEEMENSNEEEARDEMISIATDLSKMFESFSGKTKLRSSPKKQSAPQHSSDSENYPEAYESDTPSPPVSPSPSPNDAPLPRDTEPLDAIPENSSADTRSSRTRKPYRFPPQPPRTHSHSHSHSQNRNIPNSAPHDSDSDDANSTFSSSTQGTTPVSSVGTLSDMYASSASYGPYAPPLFKHKPSSSLSSLFSASKTPISDELPYLLQAFEHPAQPHAMITPPPPQPPLPDLHVTRLSSPTFIDQKLTSVLSGSKLPIKLTPKPSLPLIPRRTYEVTLPNGAEETIGVSLVNNKLVVREGDEAKDMTEWMANVQRMADQQKQKQSQSMVPRGSKQVATGLETVPKPVAQPMSLAAQFGWKGPTRQPVAVPKANSQTKPADFQSMYRVAMDNFE